MDIVKANIVTSTAGRDKGEVFFVLATEGDFLLLADGKTRPVERPKRKRRKHAALLRRVLSNLLNNAARYADPGSSIVIRIVVETHGHIKLSVINRGEPISAESLPHIFDRFFRVDASRSHGHQNHGLGLAIVSAIARMHDGEAFAISADGETEIGVRLDC